MRKSITVDFYSDAGHGWIKISIGKLKELGIIQQISNYSYINNNNAFLEEDRDAGILLRKLDEIGISYKFRHHYSNRSRIRNFNSFNPIYCGV